MGKKKRWGRSRAGGARPAVVIVILSAFAVLACLFDLIGTAPAYFRDNAIRAHGKPATGFVTEVVQYTTHSKSGAHEHYYPMLLTTIDGRSYITSTKAYSVDVPDTFARGDLVPVVFDERDPSQVVPNWVGAQTDVDESFWVVVGIGAVGLVVGGTLVIRELVTRRRSRGR